MNSDLHMISHMLKKANLRGSVQLEVEHTRSGIIAEKV